MIKIVTGYSGPGGSTYALMSLANEFNRNGIPAALYGKHSWHLNQMKGGFLMQDLNIHPDDRIIMHFLKLSKRPEAQKVILACHEKHLYPVAYIEQVWDTCVFLNQAHREFHASYTGSYTVIPNLREEIGCTHKGVHACDRAGVIGSIDSNKQTHVSILRALRTGYKYVEVFGGISDRKYFNHFVRPLVARFPNRIRLNGHIQDKRLIYSKVAAVFLSSRSEVASLVQDECEETGTLFYGSHATSRERSRYSNQEIMARWISVLDLS